MIWLSVEGAIPRCSDGAREAAVVGDGRERAEVRILVSTHSSIQTNNGFELSSTVKAIDRE